MLPGLPDVDRRELGAVFAGGAIGALARTGISQLFPTGPSAWPWAVFAINITGAFILGYLVTHPHERLPLSSYRRSFIGIGFCGAFTTFSTMQLELLNMVRHHDYGLAAGYAMASICLGYLALFAAPGLVRRMRVVR